MIEMQKPETEKPICMDLYCGAGGCSMGYYRAGFWVFGVDINPQPNYPFKFIQADAKEIKIPGWVDFIHASPECQKHSVTRYLPNVKTEKYNDDIEAIRKKLILTGKPYVIENVPGAPLLNPVPLNGLMFGLKVIRKRLFESNLFLMHYSVSTKHKGVTGSHRGFSSFANGADFITVAGKGYAFEDGKKAMGIEWMNQAELSQAIPPEYTEFLGRQIIQQIGVKNAV